MSRESVVDAGFVPVSVWVDGSILRVLFQNGEERSTPVSRFPRLRDASMEQRACWRLIGRGDGIHWPQINEDISVRGLLG